MFSFRGGRKTAEKYSGLNPQNKCTTVTSVQIPGGIGTQVTVVERKVPQGPPDSPGQFNRQCLHTKNPSLVSCECDAYGDIQETTPSPRLKYCTFTQPCMEPVVLVKLQCIQIACDWQAILRTLHSAAPDSADKCKTYGLCWPL